jgi:RNA polymerase sigma factor (sigma-70 family)
MSKANDDPILQLMRNLAHDHPLRNVPDQELLRRFANTRDQAAFAGLMRRHGSMVLDVCRNVVGNDADAEDAFQATFLILTQKAKSIRNHASISSWLYGVAYRTALKAHAECARRRIIETQLARPHKNDATEELPWHAVQQLIHAELSGLAERYRAPLVLCYLQGRSQDEAARHLGVSKATVKNRLERGRELLRVRLVRRGLGPASLVAVAAWPSAKATATVPHVLASATVKSATALAAGQATSGLLSGQVAYLLENGMKTMMLTKLKLGIAAAVVVALVPAAGGWALSSRPAIGTAVTNRTNSERPREVQSGNATKQQGGQSNPDDKDSIAHSGRVVGPDGKTISGAKLYLTTANGGGWAPPIKPPPPECATTGPDGRFAFKVPKAKSYYPAANIAATAPGYGVGWLVILWDEKRDDLTIQLVPDDVPVAGQIVDLEGKPVQGAAITVLQVNAAPGEDLHPWLEAVKEKKDLSLNLESKYVQGYTFALSQKIIVDAEGRFRLIGVGRNRLLIARLDGPTIESQILRILTRDGVPITVRENQALVEYGEQQLFTVYYGASFRHVAAPTRPIIGVVRDKDTKKPLAGVTVRSNSRRIGPGIYKGMDYLVETSTDADGRYRLLGMPQGEGFRIAAIPTDDKRYIHATKEVPPGVGLKEVTADIELKAGVWIEGIITDKETGKPVRTAVIYFALSGNPNIADYDGYDFPMMSDIRSTAEDGSYRVLGLPGPGVVTVYSKGEYLSALEREDEFGIKNESLNTYSLLSPPRSYGAVARVDPAKGAIAVKQDVTMEMGWTFKVRVLTQDGMPLAGARAFGYGFGWSDDKEAAEFNWWLINPRRPRDVLLQHLEEGLVGIAQRPKENGASIDVRMEAGATVTGRLMSADGQPRAGAKLKVLFRPMNDSTWYEYSPAEITTDKQGKLRIEAMFPGYEFRLSDGQGLLVIGGPLRSGQTADLGDVQLKPVKE